MSKKTLTILTGVVAVALSVWFVWALAPFETDVQRSERILARLLEGATELRPLADKIDTYPEENTHLKAQVQELELELNQLARDLQAYLCECVVERSLDFDSQDHRASCRWVREIERIEEESKGRIKGE